MHTSTYSHVHAHTQHTYVCPLLQACTMHLLQVTWGGCGLSVGGLTGNLALSPWATPGRNKGTSNEMYGCRDIRPFSGSYKAGGAATVKKEYLGIPTPSFTL